MPAGSFASDEVRYLRRNWGILGKVLAWLGAGVALILLAVLIGANSSAVGAPLLLGVSGYLVTLGALIRLVFTWFADEKRVPVSGHLEAGEEGLVWRGRRLARRQDLDAGFVIEGKRGETRVRLVRSFHRKPLSFTVPDEDTGRAMLTALGLDATQVAASLPLASLLRARPWAGIGNVGCLVALVPGIPVSLMLATDWGAMSVVAALLALFVLGWTALTLAPARAKVGADGVLIGWLWRRRFVPYEKLAEVRAFLQPKNAGVSLFLHGGEEVRLPLAGFLTLEVGREELSLRVRRIEQSIEASRRAQADRGVALPLRGDRPALRWLEALRAVGSGASADHRRAPIDADTLFRIAEDPGSDAERRVAAAAALGGVLDAQGRSRLRIAASTTAAPDLREALELCAGEDGSDEALAEALERVAVRR